jgi:hypothetical protein
LHFQVLANQWNRSVIALAIAEGNGRPITDGGFFHARNRPVAAQNFAQQHGFLRGGTVNVGFGIVRIRQRGLDCHDSSGIEAELHLEQVPEATQQKAGGDHQHQGKC